MRVLKLTLVLVMFFAEPAFAYVDPGTGGVLTTALLGILAAISLGAKTFFYKIRNFFIGVLGIKKNRKSKENI